MLFAWWPLGCLCGSAARGDGVDCPARDDESYALVSLVSRAAALPQRLCLCVEALSRSDRWWASGGRLLSREASLFDGCC